ncbi:MAG: archaetidylserine decarboxylase, partial [Gammaproteobacteria bacterium]|nr:archaetidylserine decarboxylase [Gammaproteobacteria bacterium]
AAQPDPRAYENFNSFFTRALKPDARPVVSGAHDIACPVDGVVSQIGRIQNGRIFQAKGHTFGLKDLLGGSAMRAAPFQNGQFATLYLSPRDYHRIHMPLSGRLREMVYVPGKLFSVNVRTTSVVPNLFARNERVIALFDTEAGPMALVLVGALFVAGIETVWSGTVTPPFGETIRQWNYQNDNIRLERGA